MSEKDSNREEDQAKKEKPQQATPQTVPPQTPQTPQPQAPKVTPQPQVPVKISRNLDKRNFFKMIVGVSAALTLIPLIPSGIFLTALTGVSTRSTRQRIGNIKDLKPNSAKNFIYPKTGNPDKDNDPFRQFILVRLPDELAKKEGKDFKAYSEVCVHLWCLWQYDSTNKMLACPCHGSMYDPVTGIAVCGPTALQAPPNDTLPELELEIDNETGDIFGVELIGELGIGRATDRKPATSFDCFG